MTITKEEAEALQVGIMEIVDSKVKPVLDRTLALLEAAVSQNVKLNARVVELTAQIAAQRES